MNHFDILIEREEKTRRKDVYTHIKIDMVKFDTLLLEFETSMHFFDKINEFYNEKIIKKQT